MNNNLNAHYFQTGSADFTQVHMNLIHGHDKKLLNVWDLDLIFKVTLEKKLLNLGRKPLNAQVQRIMPKFVGAHQ